MSTGDGSTWLSVFAWVLAPIGGIGGIGAVVWWALGKPSFEEVRRYIESFFVEPAPGTHFTVLVADLEGDEDLKQTALLAEALEEWGGLEVIRKGRKLAFSGPGGVTKARQEAEETGQGWLADHNADVLVWGGAAGSGLKLRFLPREGKGSKPEGYGRFEEEFDLPRNFEKALGAQLVALALSHVAPATEQQGTYLVALLRPAATKLKNLLAERAATLPPEQKASLHFSLGLAARIVGEQAGESQWLADAVTAFRAALEEYTRERVPLDWAKTQNNLGNALLRLGERESGTARLTEAVAAHRAAVEVFREARADHFVNVATKNLKKAEAVLEARKKRR